MKTPIFRSHQVYKWGLTSLLLASLGFSLSMNPDHFNNIARHTPLREMGFTQQASKEVAGAIITSLNKQSGVQGDQLYKVSPTTTGMGAVEGLHCSVVTPVKADTSDTEASVSGPSHNMCVVKVDGLDPLIELSFKLAELEKSQSKAEAAPKTADAKSEEKPTVDLEKLAAKCGADEDSDKSTVDAAECHKRQLIALAKSQKDNKDGAKVVYEYYETNLRPLLRKALLATQYDLEYDVMSGASTLVSKYEAVEMFEEIRELAIGLIADLPAAKGKTVVVDITKLLGDADKKRAKTSHAILAKSLNDYEAAKKDLENANNNPALMNIANIKMNTALSNLQNGYNLLSSVYPEVKETREQILDLIDSKFGHNSTLREHYEDIVKQHYYNSVSEFLKPLNLPTQDMALRNTFIPSDRIAIYQQIAQAPLSNVYLGTGTSNSTTTNLRERISIVLPGTTSIGVVGGRLSLDGNTVLSPLEMQRTQQNLPTREAFSRDGR